MKRAVTLAAACAVLVMGVSLTKAAQPIAKPPAAIPATSPSTVSLVFAGDIVLDDAAGALIARGGDPVEAFAPVSP